MEKERALRGPQDVESISISNKPRDYLGIGLFGKVHLGKVKFKGRTKPLRVAVKRFFGKVSDERAAKMQRAMDALWSAKVPMLKSMMVKHDGQWLQISHTYRRKGHSKLFDVRDFHGEQFPRADKPGTDLSRAKEYLDLVAKIANIGFYPAEDAIATVGKGVNAKFIVSDFDYLRDPSDPILFNKEPPEQHLERHVHLATGGVKNSPHHAELMAYLHSKLTREPLKKWFASILRPRTNGS